MRLFKARGYGVFAIFPAFLGFGHEVTDGLKWNFFFSEWDSCAVDLYQ